MDSTGSVPSFRMTSCESGVRKLLSACRSRPMTSTGVPDGASKPRQAPAVYPGSPASEIVGRSGRSGHRLADELVDAGGARSWHIGEMAGHPGVAGSEQVRCVGSANGLCAGTARVKRAPWRRLQRVRNSPTTTARAAPCVVADNNICE